MKNNLAQCKELDNVRFGPPVSRPSKIICVGLNYLDHAEESNMQIPKEPVIFFKSTTAIIGPLGPYLVSHNEINDVHDLKLWLKVNDIEMQNGNTKNMFFKIPHLIHYISQFMTLLPGDIISTGTPAGVGLGKKPELFYLKAGDIVELGIDHLGNSSQKIVPYQNFEI